MALNPSSPNFSSMFLVMAALLFLFFTLSTATDMSIITYNDKHHDHSNWRTDDEVMGIYQSWLAKHGKAYNGIGENEKRFQIFKDNLRFIDEHNSQKRSYKVGLNKFADLTNEEYRAMCCGTRTDARRRLMNSKVASQRYAFKAGDKLPESVDWRQQGAVNPVKDQGSCVGISYRWIIDPPLEITVPSKHTPWPDAPPELPSNENTVSDIKEQTVKHAAKSRTSRTKRSSRSKRKREAKVIDSQVSTMHSEKN